MATAAGDVTLLLVELANGEKDAADQLLPLVYDELRRVARRHLRHERIGHTLQPTALVHEAYLRLVNQRDVTWRGRAHFIGVASRGAARASRTPRAGAIATAWGFAPWSARAAG